ncbi:MAG: hypothetical protein K2X77_01780 [Candidatus Obscuribacterales bacterium]|nr:hypothetical protein [Candidatus Obscuribacterales bacterium]
MNILARMDDLREKDRIESALPAFSVNLFYARQDQSMLWLAKNADIDAVIVGIHSDPESVLRSVKCLKHGFLHIPYLCFYAHHQNDAIWNYQSLSQACLSFGASNFIHADDAGGLLLCQALEALCSNRNKVEPTIIVAGRKELVG